MVQLKTAEATICGIPTNKNGAMPFASRFMPPTPDKIYDVLPDASAEKSNIRVATNKERIIHILSHPFALVRLPDELEKLLQQVF